MTDVLDDLEVDETEWWQDGRNVTAVVSWWIDNVAGCHPGGESAARVVQSMYETPWEHDFSWCDYRDWCLEQ